jgi:hypothetical protein
MQISVVWVVRGPYLLQRHWFILPISGHQLGNENLIKVTIALLILVNTCRTLMQILKDFVTN